MVSDPWCYVRLGVQERIFTLFHSVVVASADLPDSILFGSGGTLVG